MGLATSVTVKGNLGEKIRALIAMSQDAEIEASQAVRESAFIVTAGAKDLVPISTGALFASIQPTIFNRGLSATIGSHLPYAARQEYDATLNHSVRPSKIRTRNTSSGRKGTIIKGTAQTNPKATYGFLRQSLYAEQENFIDRIRAIVRRWASA